MQRRAFILITGIALALSACFKMYTPTAEATGQQIFQEACAECHKAENKDTPGMIFTLSQRTANLTFITDRVHTSSMLMPQFPNIRGTKMQALSDYILKHSIIN